METRRLANGLERMKRGVRDPVRRNSVSKRVALFASSEPPTSTMAPRPQKNAKAPNPEPSGEPSSEQSPEPSCKYSNQPSSELASCGVMKEFSSRAAANCAHRVTSHFTFLLASPHAPNTMGCAPLYLVIERSSSAYAEEKEGKKRKGDNLNDSND